MSLDPTALARHFDCDLLAQIPLARAMQLRVAHYSGDALHLHAPLAPNVNDKGCAFGGSLASALTLAGWGLVALQLQARGIDCDVYVQDSTIRYLAPVWSDFVAEAALAQDQSWDMFFSQLDGRGRGRIAARCRVGLAEGADACVLDARFVAVRRSGAA